MQKFYSSGKLLLSGEYVVLHGAKALALPTTFGQSLSVFPNDSGYLKWISKDPMGKIWFEDAFSLESFVLCNSAKKNKISDRLVQILNEVKSLNSNFLAQSDGLKIITELEFPVNWGLGSSSTLINNIANWAKVDPYELLQRTFTGSGYDIACAQNKSPLIYQLISNGKIIEPIPFSPTFREHLYFVHLNKKQNSREAIKHYEKFKSDARLISDINLITTQMVSSNNLDEFCDLLDHHEDLIGSLLNVEPIKSSHFNDFNGSIKSLGAWGGDFILVCTETNPGSYFSERGFKTMLTFDRMIRQ
jgi:mevalonate kinase